MAKHRPEKTNNVIPFSSKDGRETGPPGGLFSIQAGDSIVIMIQAFAADGSFKPVRLVVEVTEDLAIGGAAVRAATPEEEQQLKSSAAKA